MYHCMFYFSLGTLGKMICEDVWDFEFDENFKTITPSFPLREMPADVINDLSTDQAYAYRIMKMITTGVVDWDLLQLKIGDVSHCRWLTTASRFSRLSVSKHGLVGDPLRTLRVIMEYLMSDYFPMFFEIKADSSLISGPHHKLKEIQILQRMKGKDARSKKVREIAMKFAEKGAWHAHSEHILLSLLSSQDEEDRHFALSKIAAIRKGARLGDSSPRPFVPPKLNWNATSIRNIQDWTDATEPLLTTSIPSEELTKFLSNPLQLPKIPCHTQSCERAVKEVTIASAQVFGPDRRDGYIRAKLKSRKLFPKNESKKDLVALIQD